MHLVDHFLKSVKVLSKQNLILVKDPHLELRGLIEGIGLILVGLRVYLAVKVTHVHFRPELVKLEVILLISLINVFKYRC